MEAHLLHQAALPGREQGEVLRLLQGQGQEAGEGSQVAHDALRVLAADQGVKGHQAEGLPLGPQGRHQAAVARGQVQDPVEGVLAGVLLLEAAGLAALQGLDHPGVPTDGDAGPHQARPRQGPRRVAHHQLVPAPQQDRGEVEGDELAQPLEGVLHQALGVLPQGQQVAHFVQDAGPCEGGLEGLGSGCHGGDLPDHSRHFESSGNGPS